MCGKHAKVKNPRVWKDPNNLDEKVTIIQKIWKGHSVRNWLALAGPGVLKRSLCHNDEELVSLENKTSVHPFDYFAFEENSKVYWFDIRSLSDNCSSKMNPANPYTRELLTLDTRKRLRELCVRRSLRLIKNTYNSTQTTEQVISAAWVHVCQIIAENGFFDLPSAYFVSLNRTQLYVFVNIFRQDLIAWAAEHTTNNSRRIRYLFWIKRLLGEYAKGVETPRFSYLTSKALLEILNDRAENYSICFMIMSALHRL